MCSRDVMQMRYPPGFFAARGEGKKKVKRGMDEAEARPGQSVYIAMRPRESVLTLHRVVRSSLFPDWSHANAS